MATSVPRADSRLLTCTKCGRVNNPDARFCDWCGAKVSVETRVGVIFIIHTIDYFRSAKHESLGIFFPRK